MTDLLLDVSIKDTELFKDIIDLLKELSEKDDTINQRLAEIMSKYDSEYKNFAKEE